MKRAHRFPQRLVRWTSLCVSFALILSCFVLTPLANFNHNSKVLAQGQTDSLNGNVKKVEPAPPVAGPPAGNLPNLDEVKLRGQEPPHAPASVSSTVRSRRKPLESRHGRKVGDPLPPWNISSYRTGSYGHRIRNAGANRFRGYTLSVRFHHARNISVRSPRRYGSASSRNEYGHRNDRSFIAPPEPQAPPPSATFVTTDATTQGNWKGVYGADGYNVINDAASYPSYAQVSVSGQNAYTWAASTSDGRAPLKAASNTDRIAACWYSFTNFTVDINLTDGNEHKVSVYSLDWDGNNGRQQQIQVLDAGTNAVLDSRNVLSFSGGQHTVWKLRGHVKLQVNFLGPSGANAVISGLFFDPSTSLRTNYALTSNGSVATASSTYSGYSFSPGAAIDGEHKGLNWLNGGGWNDGTTQYPDWLEVDFSGSKTIDEIDVYTVQDNYANPIEPTETMTFSSYGNTAFEVQYWNGSTWTDVPSGNVTGNNKVWRKFNFTAITTSKIRVLINDSADHIYSRLTEVEAWGNSVGGSTADQYTQNFFQWGLARQPGSEEMNYWQNMLRAAYAHQQGSMLLAVREMGRTVFESAEYAARGRSDHLYVYDLYKTYLMREPDSSGWANWEAAVPSIGRDQVRRGFDESTEFANLVATLTTSGTASSAVSSLATARIDPFNQPGSGLSARDAEWSVPLLSLPGRAGLDLGLSLSYSSMVWTRSVPYVYFDQDNGFPSPGFRLGFPTIQEKFFDAQTGVNVYLLASAGNRVELRQVGTSNVYEAADSSYLQLIDNGSLLVRTTDGTQLSYGWYDNEYRCTQIKDRNGNYLSVNYDWRGDITNLTDTLGRVITFHYDGNANPISITQTWNGQTHTWATFGWGTVTMQPSISGVVGTYNGEVIPALTQVGLDDGSHYNFEYTGAGQVNFIRRYTSDSVQRSYTAYDYASSADSSPRLTGQRVWAENWTGVNNVPNEVVTQFSDPGDGSHVMTAPDGTIYKEIYGTGWQKGLTTQSEVWSGGVRQKWTTTAWTQDNTSVNYQTNPRVTETNIYDVAGNRRRTTIDYGSYAQYGLPNGVFEYAADGVTLLRVTYTDYNLSQAYLDGHIIGLVSAVHVSDGAWRSKVIYSYDAAGDQLQATSAAAIQHDAGYGTGFVTGRGNVTAVSRYDVTDIGNDSKALTTRMGYDIDGSVIFARDALNHQTTMIYNDAFSTTGTSLDAPRSFATFAYPTTVTDPDGYSSSLWYRYDFGAKTRAQGPPPAGQTQGAIRTLAYDDAVRLQQVTTANTGAYTRYVYAPNYVQSFSSVNSVADDAYAFQIFDGAGHVFAAGGYHPGSSGGFKAQLTYYDVMGRAMKQSNPTEIYGNWAPAGDDAAGWIFTQQTYDWKGRPRITTNTDGTQKSATYSACGCAGSEVTTLTDEVGRQQRIYSDVMGRHWKTEIMNGTSAYSSSVSVYNGRDQVERVKQYAGAAPADASSTNAAASCPTDSCQESTMSYDGYGRLKTKHVPEQQVDPNNSSSTDHSTWTYNADDTVYSDTDARGATCTYGYNNRHQVTSATHTLSGQTTIALSYGYDAAGNRTSMTDSPGSMTYSYDQLSRLTSETRYFSALSNSTTGGNYAVSYQYNLANELTSVTDPFGAQIGYTRDTVGRTTAVMGSGFANVSSYVSNIQYRAWGGVKAAAYGNNSASTTSYNNRLQPSQFRLTDANSGASYIRENYAFYGDGRLQSVADLDDTGGTNPPATLRFLSRSYGYDQTGRVAQVYSSNQAPMNQTYGYDEFDNMTSRAGSYYWQPSQSATFTYTNNRHNGWSYYADGQVSSSPATTTDDAYSFSYDAAGGLSRTIDTATNRLVDYRPSYDGDGNLVNEWSQITQNGSTLPATSSFIVRSTVLRGEILTRLDQNGNKSITYVPAEGLLFATQGIDYQGSPYVGWTQRNPLGITETGKGIYDPLGTYIPFQQHDDPRPPVGSYNSSSMSGIAGSVSANPFGSDTGCLMNGLPTACSSVLRAINNGQADKVTVYGFSTSVELSQFTASYASVTTRPSHYHLGPSHSMYIGYGPPPASQVAVQFVITPGFQLGFEPNPQNSGAGGGAGPMLNTGPRASFDPKKFDKCLQSYFGIVPDHQNGIRNPFFDRRYGGSFTGFANGDPGHTYSVITKIDRSSVTLARQLNTANNTPNYWFTQSGLTLGTDFSDANGNAVRYGVNFVASDVAADPKNLDIGLFGIYVHETGNALGAETGMDDPFGAYAAENAKHGVSDPDVGAAFERCVFGGLVGLRTGRIGSHREF
jgi:YD repeat-containing protein